MAYVADLHIHSRFSRACSQAITIPNLSKWAKIKGIDLLGTGDFLHPLWQKEIQKVLKDSGNGFFEYEEVRFVLSCEIACIYSDHGSTKRIHLVILLPSFESVAKLSTELMKRRINLASDGRPISGLSAYKLTEIVLDTDKDALIIPAHIWTPWFSLFGSMSGYNHFQDCFGNLSDQIYGIETGLSSDPAMNWRIAELDGKSIVSFSDAHSLPNLGREATIFGGSFSFNSLKDDLKTGNILGTIEFFPEEGKYHYSGHRDHNIVYSPEDIKQKGEICPICGKRLTIGVMQRVEELATRTTDDLKLKANEGVIQAEVFPKRAGFRMLVGLEKIIAEALHSTTAAQKVKDLYFKMIDNLDDELKILTKTPLEEIKKVAGEKVAEGVERVRNGKLHIEPGYDNTYGVIKIWDKEAEKKSEVAQMDLFGE